MHEFRYKIAKWRMKMNKKLGKFISINNETSVRVILNCELVPRNSYSAAALHFKLWFHSNSKQIDKYYTK